MDTTFLGKILFTFENFSSNPTGHPANSDQCSEKRTGQLMAEYYYYLKNISADISYP